MYCVTVWQRGTLVLCWRICWVCWQTWRVVQDCSVTCVGRQFFCGEHLWTVFSTQAASVSGTTANATSPATNAMPPSTRNT
jgi:hypothetical protein